MAGSYVNAPTYPTPNWDNFGQQLGNIPADMQKQQFLALAQQQEQMQLDQQRKLQEAFAGGLPMENGQPNWAQALQKYAQAGDTASVAKLAPLAMEQRQIDQAAAPSPLFGGAGGPGGQPAASGDELSKLEAGVAKVETGGQKDPYSAKGPVTKSGDRAYGKYQVMGANIPLWTEKVLGRKMTPSEFLNDPDAQEKVARTILGGYLAKTGDAPDAASMWFTGKPLAEGANRRDVNNMSGARYAELATGVKSDATPRAPPSAAMGGVGGSGDRSGTPAAGVGVRGGAPGSIAAMVASLEPDPNKAPAIAGRFAKSLGVDQNANLTPEQAQRAQERIGNWAKQTGRQPVQQPGPVGAGAAGGAGPASAPLQDIVPQIPLPPGFKRGQEQQAILAIDQEMARLSANPAAQGQVKALADWRDRIASSADPMKLTPGQMIASPTSGKTFQAPYPEGGNLSPQALDSAAEAWLKNGKMPPNLGRGQQGAQNIAAITNRGWEIAAEKGLSPSDVLERQQSFGAMAAGKRLLSNRVVGLELVGNEAQKLIPVLEKTIDQLGNGQYSDINAAINNLKKRSGNEDLIRLGVSAESLKSVYARVLKAGGTPTEGAAKKADDLFSGAWSKGQMRTALDQMKIELKNAKESVHDTMKEFKLTTGDFEDELKTAKAETGDQGAQGGGAPIAPGTKLDGGFVYKGPR